MKHLVLIIIAIIFSSSSLFAVSEKVLEGLPKFSLCKNRKIVRIVRVVKGKDDTCLTYYSKAGVENIVGSASTDISCYKFYENIRNNLSSAGWKCSEHDSAQVTVVK